MRHLKMEKENYFYGIDGVYNFHSLSNSNLICKYITLED